MIDLLYNVHDIFDASSRRGCLQQYRCEAYRIPPYQRGYKWGSEENQPVHTLLSDLKRAWKNKGRGKEYLLQAITVKRVSDGRGGWVLEVIDGQQRLTTLFILIHALQFRLTGSALPNIAVDKLRYSIRHDTPTLDELVVGCMPAGDSAREDFEQLKARHGVDREERQDCHYLKCAALRCVHALGSDFQTDAEVDDFQKFVVGEVKLMVNGVEAHISGEEIFGNLNSNRIVLTETELIKGLLLTRVAREPAAARPRRYREVLEMRIRLGREWDEVNHWANLPEIRRLYFPEFKDGMRGLLELVARQMPEPFKPPKAAAVDGKPLFEYFFLQDQFEPVFRRLENTCAQLQDWHEDTKTYHLLNFCLMPLERAGERLSFLGEQLSRTTKTELIKGLYERRRSILGGPRTPGEEAGEVALHKLGYGENNSQIEFLLLALSVFQVGASGRFNFSAFQDEEWSLEHIFPQSPFGKDAKLNEGQLRVIDSLIENKEGVLTKETTEQISRLRDAGEPDRAEIERLLQSEPLLHRVGNLCLLSRGDNAAMGCGMFDEKRRVVRERIARGSFVPSHTYEVFSKMIVGEDESLNVWSKRDIENHQTEIARRISALKEEHP